MESGTMTLYKVSEVAERFKVNPKTVLDWIREGDLAAYKVGNTDSVLRISEEQIQEYLKNHESGKDDPHDDGNGDNDEVSRLETDA